MNKLAIWLSSVFVLLLFCNQSSEALFSSHKKKSKTRQTLNSESSTFGSSHHKRHRSSANKHKTHISKHWAPKPRYAYAADLFLMEPPTFEATPLPDEISTQIKKAFYSGNAGQYPTRSLVRAGIASYYPMRGGVFWRREPIKYLIMHSTEPGIPVGAKTIIDGWSHGGRRHAGAHYVIDRDGIIYQAVDPDLATVHVNIFKTLPGINNDNSVGIEMCHQGSQDYPPALVESAAQLAAYLQSHYHIQDANIITHRYAQQGDHTDPVNFAWDNFIAQKDSLQNQGLNQKLSLLKTQILKWQPIVEQPTIIIVDKKSPPSAPKLITPKQATAKTIEVQTPPTAKTTAPSNQSAFEAKFGTIDKAESAFEAKFGPIDKPASSNETKTTTISKTKFETTPETQQTQPLQTQSVLAAPLPSNGSSKTPSMSPPMNNSNNAPAVSSNTNRLIPPSTNRLVPVTMIINTQPKNNAMGQTPGYLPPSISSQRQLESQTNSANTARRSSKNLPLRGPIEMEPDEASLLSQ